MKFAAELDRALAVHRQGKLREAFLRYDAILRAEPRHAAALHYSGVVLHQSGQHAAAAERIRTALDIDPSDAEAWISLGKVFDAMARPEQAIATWKEALRRAPDSVDAAAGLSAALLARGQAIEAEAVARRALDADAQRHRVWHILALALERQGRVGEALDAVQRATRIAPAEGAYAALAAQLAPPPARE
jgi:tetratricopeptide (TPR) repeat protein